MHTFTALVLCATLAGLAGCITDAAEAVDTHPVASSPQPLAGQEISTMFSDEKARATTSDLPGQF
jgi:hypothetical protein